MNKEEVSQGARMAIADLDKEALEKLILAALDSGMSPLEIAHEVIFPHQLKGDRLVKQMRREI